MTPEQIAKIHEAADRADDRARDESVAVLNAFADRLTMTLSTIGIDASKSITPQDVQIVASAIGPMLSALRSDLIGVLTTADQAARHLALVHFAAILGLPPLPLAMTDGDASWLAEVDAFVAQLRAVLVAQIQRGQSQGWAFAVIVRSVAGRKGSVASANRGKIGQLAHLMRVGAYSDEIRRAAVRTNEIEAATRDAPQADPQDAAPLVTVPGRVRLQIVEVLDARNHPFSRVANGTTANADEDFRVSIAEVASMARSMRKGSATVFWRAFRGFYVGRNLPAHYGDRGRLVPVRA